MFRCSYMIIRERINALPDDDVTVPKYVGAVLLYILILF